MATINPAYILDGLVTAALPGDMFMLDGRFLTVVHVVVGEVNTMLSTRSGESFLVNNTVYLTMYDSSLESELSSI